ncbi:hypothetical protein [Aporhodopirellula aestuarii]|uniref:Uncharacterized protein n=1 Tax=Aporhodopirellula aestuarii TaxID=2950107 RepID=A0ABT0UAR9_9BACT|nr:hypothetical protein [Aporhodopirellula aestuarii]MCM2373910.1 hypothetical protein [Aporhodopirellula aestuarii]
MSPFKKLAESAIAMDGETVFYVPRGVEAAKYELIGDADWHDEDESMSGAKSKGDRGRSTERTVYIELPARRIIGRGTLQEANVPVVVKEDGKDLVQLKDPVTQRWVNVKVHGVIGRDRDSMTLKCSCEIEYRAQSKR